MKAWKIAFWITATLLIVSNLFWMYQVIYTAVGHGYYQVSCEEYKENSDILNTTLNGFENVDDLIAFLEKHKIEFEIINKADNENYIIIGSLGTQFLDNGEIVSENEKKEEVRKPINHVGNAKLYSQTDNPN
jgi:hypothetical protein